jgi:thiol:disulfide interchange protein DsbD
MAGPDPLQRAVSALLLCAVTSAGAAGAAEGPEYSTPQGTVRLISRWASAPRGGDAGLGVRFALAPGWHVYWKNSGDAGYPPALAISPAAGLEGGTLRYPAPERFDLPGGLVSFGYGGEMVYPVEASVAAEAPDTIPVRARLDYLVCAGECVPYTAALALDLPVGGSEADPRRAGEVDAWRARLPVPLSALGAGAAARARWSPAAEGAGTLALELDAPGLRAADPDLFFEPQDLLALDRPRFVAAAAGPRFEVAARALDRTKPLPPALPLTWTVTGFETDRGALAIEGTTALATSPPAPADGARRSRLPVLALALAAAAALAFALVSRRTFQGASR